MGGSVQEQQASPHPQIPAVSCFGVYGRHASVPGTWAQTAGSAGGAGAAGQDRGPWLLVHSSPLRLNTQQQLDSMACGLAPDDATR